MAHDHQRRDFRHHRQISGDKDDGAVLPYPAGKRQGETGEQRRDQGRPQHSREGLPAIGAQAGGGLLLFGLSLPQHGLQGAHHEGQADESEGDHHPYGVVGELYTKGGNPLTYPAVGGEDGAQGNAGDGSRHGERQVDERIHQAATGETVTHQHPGQDQPEQAVEQGGDKSGPEAEAKGGEHPGGAYHLPELGGRQVVDREQHQCREGQQYQYAQVEQTEAQGRSQTREDGIRT